MEKINDGRKRQMKVINENIGNISLEYYMESSQDLLILIAASYNKQKRQGKSKCVMYYRQKTKVTASDFTNVQSANQVMVYGLLEAVGHILISEVKVCVISYIAPGFASAEKGKGLYADVVNQIVDTVEKQGNKMISIVATDKVEEIKQVIRKYEK